MVFNFFFFRDIDIRRMENFDSKIGIVFQFKIELDFFCVMYFVRVYYL